MDGKRKGRKAGTKEWMKQGVDGYRSSWWRQKEISWSSHCAKQAIVVCISHQWATDPGRQMFATVSMMAMIRPSFSSHSPW